MTCFWQFVEPPEPSPRLAFNDELKFDAVDTAICMRRDMGNSEVDTNSGVLLGAGLSGPGQC